jgi:hypothetical protein
MTRINVQLTRLEGRETVVLLIMTPSTSLSLITEAISSSSGSLRSGAILTTSLGARVAREVDATFLRAAFAPFKRCVSAERVCSPLRALKSSGVLRE